MNNLGKILIVLGVIFLAAGVVLVVFKKIPFNLGKLPGDIIIKKENFSFYFPITTSIIISVVVSLVLYVVSKFIGK
jgi:hypothetical protein